MKKTDFCCSANPPMPLKTAFYIKYLQFKLILQILCVLEINNNRHLKKLYLTPS